MEGSGKGLWIFVVTGRFVEIGVCGAVVLYTRGSSAGVSTWRTGRVPGGRAPVAGTKKVGLVSFVCDRDPLIACLWVESEVRGLEHSVRLVKW